ncbi:hypothetical protein EV127DRAFT_351879 [Xylaria flabelliformis]|nr:hypothetical protein EV127DRAFT_351879 [Xylaria flabelliformis]
MNHSASTLGQTGGAEGIGAPKQLATAIDEFLEELKQKHKEDSNNPFLQALTTYAEMPRLDDGLSQSEASAQELQISISELDAQKRTRKSYRLLHRLSPFLEIFKSVLKKCESLAQAAPFGVAIAFAGARIVLEMALAVEEYLEIVVTAMERIAGILEVYKRLASSPDLGTRLVNSYKEIITFWYKLSKVLSSPKSKGILPRTLVTPLKKEAEESLKNLQEDMHINLGISQAAGLLMADMDRQARAEADQRSLKNDIRRWIMGQSGVDFKGDYEIQLDLRHENTCTWILEDRRFLDWYESRDNALLWYNAQPGSGKSVLASAVIDYLAQKEKKVAYFFYSFSKNSSRHVSDGLRTLALQLLAFAGTPSDKLVDLYEKETQFSPYLNNLRITTNVVHELITRNDDLYVVIDGIDECEDEKEMLNFIEWLLNEPTLGTVRWLFTNRVSEIEKTMKKLQAVEVCPSPENIRADIQNYLSKKIRCKHCLRAWTNECDNNFLIARFVSETLGKLTSEEDIEAELKMFPKKLNGYYARTLAKIDARGRMEQLVARRIFLILSSAQQAMCIDELIDALGIQRGSQDYSASRIPKEELIRDLCGSLIIVEEHVSESNRSHIIRFCHKSVKDFFHQDPKTADLGVDESLHKYFVAPSNAHEEIGLDCLTYLMYSRYSKHIDLGFLDSAIPKEHAFLRYAATFWFQHLGDKFISKPSPAVSKAVQEFISSKNFWNCLRVQSYVVPYLFGRYMSQERSFKMAIKGQEWKGDDSFAVPLPTWLGDHSPDNLLRDQSLCHFAEEWREVIITHPHGLDQCVSIKPFANSCWLKSLAKANTVKCVNLEGAFGSDILTASKILGVGFSSKKLWVDVAYQTRDGPEDMVWRLRQPLFKANAQPQRSNQRLPIDSDILEWAICPLVTDDVMSELVAYNIDLHSLDLRKANREHSERIESPQHVHEKRTMSKTRWETLGHYVVSGSNNETSIHVMHMSRKNRTKFRLGFGENDDEHDGDDSDESSKQTSDVESDSEDEFSDDDTSSEQSNEESTAGETSTDESDVESSLEDHDDTDCLILISKDRPPYWTKPWTHPPLLWSRIACALHPTEHLVAFMHTPSQLEVVDLEKDTQVSINVLGLIDEPKDGLASTRGSDTELRFSRCGKHVYCLSITFNRKEHCTECTVMTSSFRFPLNESDGDTITATKLSCVVYTFADPLLAIDSPFALTYWCDNHVIVALPPLTCNPKILKIALDSDRVSTLRNPIYFPASTPRRDPRLVFRPNTKDSEGYVFLVLNAVPPAKNAVVDTSSPVVALRWSVPDEEGWRSWTDEDATAPDLTNDCPIWSFMRGNFVESGKPFSVPVRCGLNWTRKSYLSCA